MMTDKKEKPMLGFAGRYQLTKHKVDADGNIIPGTEEVVLPWFDNLITNSGLDRMAVGGCIVYCRLGTGSASPTTADTNLGAQVAAHSSVVSNTSGVVVSSPTNYMWRKRTYRFNAGTASGVNLTEVGLGWVASGVGIFSRSLLKDTGGDPVTIVLAADEVLDVAYELRCYYSTTPQTATVTIDGVSTTVTYGAYGSGAQGQWQAAAAGLGGNGILLLSGNSSDYNWRVDEANLTLPGTATAYLNHWYNGGVDAYVPGSYSIAQELSLGLSQFNYATGIGSIQFGLDGGEAIPGGIGVWAFSFSPKIQKTASKTGKIKVGLTWGRYTP